MMRNPPAAGLAEATGRFLAGLDDERRARVRHRFDDAAERRRWTYLPGERTGLSFGDLTRPQRKALHALLAGVLRPHAYAQAAAIMALEDVLDHAEGHRRGRHNTDYWIAVFGDPGTDEPWGWRFEGHHLSLNLSVVDGRVTSTPCFFGANPATVRYRGTPVLAPLTMEEGLARSLLAGLTPDQRRRAVVADTAPADIRTRSAPRIAAFLEPRGVPASALDSAGVELLHDLVALYLDRFRPEFGPPDPDGPGASGEVFFAWEGPLVPGAGHYYRVQGPDLFIEYDNTANDANHIHSVVRRPGGDFGADLLAGHYEHHPHPVAGR